MNAYEQMTKAEREAELKKVRAEFDALCAKKLSLNMARGKPGAHQLDLSTDMLTIVNDPAQCKIDGIETSEDAGKYYLEIKGWVIERSIESKSSDTIRVVLKDVDTGKYYYIPTRRTSKSSITRQFYDGTTYDDCGFEAKVRLGKELSGNASEYEVFIYVSNGNGTKLVKTDVGVVSWLTGR